MGSDIPNLTKHAVDLKIQEIGMGAFIGWVRALDPDDSGKAQIERYLESEYGVSLSCECQEGSLRYHAPSGRWLCIFCETDSV